MVWLSGVRRVGKTTLVHSLSDIEYFDLERPSVRRQFEDPERLLASLEGKRVVFDEVHRLANPSELLKLAADYHPGTRIVATGSSTLHATSTFRDTLTGRKTDVWLTPMMSADLEAFGGDLMSRLAQGGLPPFFLAESGSTGDFQEWMDSYWARDIQELFRLERRASFLRFVELILARSGGMFEATAFAGPCEVSRPTIANYLQVLEVTRVAHVVRPFSTRRTTEIVAAPKVYAFDTGFVTEYRGWNDLRPDDLGHLWEHYVLNEIQARIPSASVHYWRDTRHNEVDFVIVPHGRHPIAIECKWSDSARDEFGGLRTFRRAYPEGDTYVVSADVERPYVRALGDRSLEVVGLTHLIERLRVALGE